MVSPVQIMIVGGDEAVDTRAVPTWIFDTRSNQFSSGGNLGTPRKHLACGSFVSSSGEKVVMAFAGSEIGPTASYAREKWTESSGSWTPIASLWDYTSASTMVTIDNRLIFMGMEHQLKEWNPDLNTLPPLVMSNSDLGFKFLAIPYNI